jgi:hypothetical protein
MPVVTHYNKIENIVRILPFHNPLVLLLIRRRRKDQSKASAGRDSDHIARRRDRRLPPHRHSTFYAALRAFETQSRHILPNLCLSSKLVAPIPFFKPTAGAFTRSEAIFHCANRNTKSLAWTCVNAFLAALLTIGSSKGTGGERHGGGCRRAY